MRHIPRWLRWLSTTLGILLGSGFLSPLIQANWQKWAEQTGNDLLLVKYMGPAMLWLAEITQSGWFIFAVGFFVGGAIFLWADYFLRHRVPVNAAIAPSDRVFINDTPEHLMALGKDHTSIIRDKVTEIYFHKWLNISGKVKNVIADGSGGSLVMVSFNDGNAMQHVLLWFNEQWYDRASMLRIDQNISAIGRIRKIGHQDIELDNCELKA